MSPYHWCQFIRCCQVLATGCGAIGKVFIYFCNQSSSSQTKCILYPCLGQLITTSNVLHDWSLQQQQQQQQQQRKSVLHLSVILLLCCVLLLLLLGANVPFLRNNYCKESIHDSLSLTPFLIRQTRYTVLRTHRPNYCVCLSCHSLHLSLSFTLAHKAHFLSHTALSLKKTSYVERLQQKDILDT